MLIVGHSFGCENLAYMSIHGFSVFDFRYHYRSISTHFRFDSFVSDVSIFHYLHRFQAYRFQVKNMIGNDNAYFRSFPTDIIPR
jgi:hypothetical protein